MKYHNLLLPLLLVALSLSLLEVPAVKAANANILYVNPGNQGPFPMGTTVTYQVRVSQMDSFNAWDIKVSSDPAVLNPVSLSITPNTLTGNFSLSELELTNCVNGSGTGCSVGDGPGVAHSAVFPLGSDPSVASISGTLFTITYTVTAPSLSQSSAVQIFDDAIAGNGVTIFHTSVSGAYNGGVVKDFTISATPSSQTLSAPSSGTATATYLVTVSPVGGFTGNVNLATTISPSGQGVAASTDTLSVSIGPTASASANLMAVVQSNATAGQYAIVVTGSATVGTHSASVSLTVTRLQPDYIISLNPNPLPPILAGYSGVTTVTITSVDNFAGTITLSATTSPTGVSNGPVASFSSNMVTVSANQSASVTMSVLTFPLTPVPAPSPSGLYAIIVIGNSGPLTHSALAVVAPKPAVFFRHLSWTHHFDYSTNAGVQTFDARVQNNSTGTVTAQVVVLVRCGSFRTFVHSDPAGTMLPGGNVTAGIAGPIVTITFSVTLPTSVIGDECTVRGALFYGGSSSTTLTSVAVRRNTFTTNIVHPLIAVNGKTKSSPSGSINFQFEVTLTGKFFVKP